MQTLYLVVGVSGSGKSWAVRQVAHLFHYIPHDRCWVMPGEDGWDPSHVWAADLGDDSRWEEGAVSNHLEVLVEAVRIAEKPVITECPFQERALRESLEAEGIEVVPIFVIENPEVVAERYEAREGKEIPKAVKTRAASLINRAEEWEAFSGTSDEVLEHLKRLAR